MTEATLLHSTHFRPAAKDLTRLAPVCTQFTTKCIAAPPGDGGSAAAAGDGVHVVAAAAAAAPEMLSLVVEAGRQWVAGCSEQERGWVPRLVRESWIGLAQISGGAVGAAGVGCGAPLRHAV